MTTFTHPEAEKPSKLLNAVLTLVDGYNKWDIDGIIAARSPDSMHQILPLKLGHEPKDNEEYRKWFIGAHPIFQNFHFELYNIVEDPSRNRVAARARSSADTAIGRYDNEYMCMFEMTEDQEKVRRVDEFVDSMYTREFFGRLAEKLKEDEQEREKEKEKEEQRRRSD